jgi:hypothetical protein
VTKIGAEVEGFGLGVISILVDTGNDEDGLCLVEKFP